METGDAMLVLTRKPGQSIIIGNGIEVQVLSVVGEKVRLGITAPRDVGIFRNEVQQRIDEEEDSPKESEDTENGDIDDVSAVLHRVAPGS
jgi:carbon storage regulator